MNDPVFSTTTTTTTTTTTNNIIYNNNKAMATFHTYIHRGFKGGFLS